MYTVEIDLKGIVCTQDIFDRFKQTFGFHDTFGNNWSALYDSLIAMDSDSKLISKLQPVPDSVHFVIKNYDCLKVIDQERQGNFGTYNDYQVFNKLLIDLTDNHTNWRGEGAVVNIKITFEVHHGDW